MAGVEVEPLKSREHILLTTILLAAWQAGESPDLAMLIQRIQQPPMTRIGVIDLESFYPAKDRFELAMTINALIASPGFEVWMQGEPLDVAAFLRTSSGKPRVSIFSIAHLDDAQRMFFVSLLLNAVAGWMRGQTGTSSLRALVYMDEIFGFFPPTANPPSKGPLLTLLKQGRAAGVGVVLATQNPVDLDYKGLSNIGTWWLGRLQTERDKARLLDGLEGASDHARLRSLGDRSAALEPHQPCVPHAQRPRGQPDAVSVALGAVVPARPARARRHQAAHRGAQGRGACGARSCVSDAAGVCAGLDRGRQRRCSIVCFTGRRSPCRAPGGPAVLLAGSGRRTSALDAGRLRGGERAVRRSETEGR